MRAAEPDVTGTQRVAQVEHHRDLAHRERPAAARQYILQQDEPPDETQEAITQHPTVIAEMTTEINVLSVGEAAMRMDLADQAVMMFRNRASRELNVVYRRPDGHIGWIDPGPSGSEIT